MQCLLRAGFKYGFNLARCCLVSKSLSFLFQWLGGMTDSYSEFSFSVEYYIEFILTFFFLLITTGSKGSFIYKKKIANILPKRGLI